jgi:hypothetical protein
VDIQLGIPTLHRGDDIIAEEDLVGDEDPLYAHVSKFTHRGLEVKLLRCDDKSVINKPHFDFPAERAENGKYYPKTFAGTPEDRAVIHAFVFAHQPVQDAMVEMGRLCVQAMEEAAAAAAGGEIIDGASCEISSAGVHDPFA